MSNQGTIVQIIGAVIDADFSKAGKLPEIFNALEINYVLNDVDTKLVLEVQQHLGDGWVRAVAMSTTDGLKRGMTLTDTGKADRGSCRQAGSRTHLQRHRRPRGREQASRGR